MNQEYKIRVYKIVNDDTDEIYIGSTRQSLNKRWYEHKNRFLNKVVDTSSKILFEKYGIDKCHIILIKEYWVENSEQQRKKERYHYDKLKAFVINPVRPHSTIEERKENQKARTMCLCGAWFMTRFRKRHNATKKHIKFMEANANILTSEQILCQEIKPKHVNSTLCECGGYFKTSKNRHQQN